MRFLTIVHQDDSGPGVFGEVIVQAQRAGSLRAESWYPAQDPDPPAPPQAYGAILICGGEANPPEEDRYPWLKREKAFLADALACGTPLFGICLGAELIAEAAGTRTRRGAVPEIGWYPVSATTAAASDPLLAGLQAAEFEALEWHSYEIPLPQGAVALGASPNCLQAYRLGECVWGVQFHPEVTATDFRAWIADIPNDASWPLVGRDAGELLAQTEARLDDWHRFGRALAERFLKFASGR